MTGPPDAGGGSTPTPTPILHVDMDAFYASVSLRDRPDLAGSPVIVGGGSRGVVLCATYPARACGVHSAMPMTRARRLCPHAVVLQPDFAHYRAVSAAVMETFASITPLVRAVSLDEAFLDVSGAHRRLGPPRQIADHLRARIVDEQGVTCSVGIAATTSVAKLASRQAKPDGVVEVRPERVSAFLHPLPVDALWGVGDKTAEQLRRLGLVTVGDVAHTPLATLRRALGPTYGRQLHALAWGGGERAVQPRRSVDEPERSIGSEETFDRDTDDPAVVRRELLRLSTAVAARLRSAEVAGRTVTVKVRFADFTTLTRSRTLRDPTDVTAAIYPVAVDLYAGLRLQRARVRLVGVRVENLVPAAGASRQLRLGERDHGWCDAERAVDQAATRFGSSVIRPATLLSARVASR